MRCSRDFGHGVGVVVVAVVFCACSASHTQVSKAQAARSPVRTRPRVAAPATATSPGPRFTLDKAAVTAAYIPAGFVPVEHFGIPGNCRASCARHVDGPLPDWTHDSQEFWNATTGQGFTIYVTRGESLAFIFAPNQVWPYVRSPRRVTGHDTYVHTVLLGGAQREFTWVVGPKTVGGLVGLKMTDDELLRIADGMRVAP
jgi:hypothetical protein